MTEAPPPPPQEPERPAGGATPPPPDPGYSQPTPPPAAGQPTPPPAYGEPAQPAQPPAYGEPAAPPQAYGAPPAYGAPGGPPPGVQLASWGLRVQSALVDSVGPSIVAYIFYFINHALGSILFLAAFAWALYQAYQGGQTGQSLGKKMAGTRLAREADGQNIGGGLGIGRYFLHIVDSIPCVPVGYLWPLWDAKKQTFADKILKTVVVKV